MLMFIDLIRVVSTNHITISLLVHQSTVVVAPIFRCHD